MSLAKYLTPNRIRIRLDAVDWRDLIEQVGDIMLQAGDIEERYINAMKQVTEEMGPYSVIAPGVVLLHGRPEDGVLRISFVAATLKKEINFGSANDPVLLAIGMGALNHSSHIEALRDLAQLLNDKEKVSTLIESKTVDEFIRVLNAS